MCRRVLALSFGVSATTVSRPGGRSLAQGAIPQCTRNRFCNAKRYLDVYQQKTVSKYLKTAMFVTSITSLVSRGSTAGHSMILALPQCILVLRAASRTSIRHSDRHLIMERMHPLLLRAPALLRTSNPKTHTRVIQFHSRERLAARRYSLMST